MQKLRDGDLSQETERATAQTAQLELDGTFSATPENSSQDQA